MTKPCTWKDCLNEAKHDQKGRDGKVWASLCEGHHKALDEAIDNSLKDTNPRMLIAAWANAGHKARDWSDMAKATSNMIGSLLKYQKKKT